MIDFKTIVRKDFIEKNSVLYFIDVPQDVQPSRHKDPTNKKLWSPWRRRNYEFFKKELSVLPAESIVADLGAGEMQFRNIFERLSLVAVDFYPYPGIRLVCDLNRSLPFLSTSIDAVVLSNTLEHIAEPNILLAECQRILKPGGVILGAVPFMIDIHMRPYDYYRYTDVNLHYLLKKHAFSMIEVQPVLILASLAFTLTSSFFIQLIQKTKYSQSRIVQALHIFGLRVLWKIVRTMFAILNPIFARCENDKDLPLGYHFKAKKLA